MPDAVKMCATQIWRSRLKTMVDFPASHRQFVKGFYTPGWQCLAQNVQLPLMIRMHNSSSQILAPPWCLCHLDLVVSGRGFFFVGFIICFFSVFLRGQFLTQVNSGTSIERIGCVNGFWCKTSCWLAIGLKRKEIFSWSIGGFLALIPGSQPPLKKWAIPFGRW